MLRAGSNRPISALLQSSLPVAGPGGLGPLMRAVKDARYVLLGEASHGTHEFYTWRTEITKRLVLEQQCSFIAVEGDWPDCYRLNRYIKGLPGSGDSAEQVLHAFDRWPTWMWANREIVSLAEWLRRHNDTLPPEKKVGFYGLERPSTRKPNAGEITYRLFCRTVMTPFCSSTIRARWTHCTWPYSTIPICPKPSPAECKFARFPGRISVK